MGRDVADGEANAPVIGTVRLRSVEQQHMVKRGLARLQLNEHGLRLVDIDCDLLTPGEQVVLVEGVFVLDLALVGPGNELHAAGNLIRRRHGDPGGGNIGRTEAPIGRVLMPGNKTRIVRFLDEEAGVPAQDIRPEQILHGIQDFGVPHHLVDPGEQHVAAVAHLALDRAPALGFIILELAAKIGYFARAECIDRKVVTTVAITSDVILAQQFWHGFLQYSCSSLQGAR